MLLCAAGVRDAKFCSMLELRLTPPGISLDGGDVAEPAAAAIDVVVVVVVAVAVAVGADRVEVVVDVPNPLWFIKGASHRR